MTVKSKKKNPIAGLTQKQAPAMGFFF